MRVANHRFRGSVARSFVSRGWPLDSLVLSANAIRLRSFRGEVQVPRPDVLALEFRRARLPLLLATFVVIRLNDNGYHPQMFIAYRSQRLRRLAEELGWPVEDGRVTGRNVLNSPKP